METDRRKGLRREHDKELDRMLQELRADFQSHVIECTENGKVLRSEVGQLKRTQTENHSQNIARFEGLKTMTEGQNETLDTIAGVLDALSKGKKITVGFGRLVIWLGSIIGALLATAAGWTWLKTH